jgi:hypothetical protein
MVKEERVDSRFRGNDEDNAVLPAWVVQFWAGLIVNGSVREALAEAGVDFETAWAWREEHPVFAMYWDRAVRLHKAVLSGVPMLAAMAAEEAQSPEKWISFDQMEEYW